MDSITHISPSSPQAQPIEAGQQAPKLETSGGHSASTEQATRTRFRGIRNILSNLFLNGMPQCLKNLRTRRVETQANDKTRLQNFKGQFRVPKGLFFGVGTGKTAQDKNPPLYQPPAEEAKPADEAKPVFRKIAEQGQQTLNAIRERYDEGMATAIATNSPKKRIAETYQERAQEAEQLLTKLRKNDPKQPSESETTDLEGLFRIMISLAESDHGFDTAETVREELLKDWLI